MMNLTSVNLSHIYSTYCPRLRVKSRVRCPFSTFPQVQMWSVYHRYLSPLTVASVRGWHGQGKFQPAVRVFQEKSDGVRLKPDGLSSQDSGSRRLSA